MICLVAVIVFGIMGIFSAKYRELAQEAFQCTFKLITLRPCDSSFDERMKGKIVGKLLSISPFAARGVNKHFPAISLVFVAIFFVSLIYSGIAGYNYWAYGNCNGPNTNAFCAFDTVFKPSSTHSFGQVTLGIGPTLGNGSITMVEFGCFTCPVTKQAQPQLNAFLAKHPEVKLEFRAYPIPTHNYSREASEAAFCALDQGNEKFWQYSNLLFAYQEEFNNATFLAFARQVNLNETQFEACYGSGKYISKVQRDINDGNAARVYGTPTFFIGNITLIGIHPVSDFEDALGGKVADTKTIGICAAPKTQ
ncbi:MAG: thioredoxin domain-containing protein [Candidatus Micrarchaeota archaeon]